MFKIKDGLRLAETIVIDSTGNILTNAATATRFKNPIKFVIDGDSRGILYTNFANTAVIQTNLIDVGTPGTYSKVTVDAKGRVTAGTSPTTLFGYGITDAVDLSSSQVITGTKTFTNVTINGTLTVANSAASLTINDPIITVGASNTGTALFLGMKAERGAVDAFLVWNEDLDRWASYTSTNGMTFSSADLEGRQIISTIGNGTAPFSVSSNTVVTNLNADLLDGQDGPYYTNASNISTGTLSLNRLANVVTAGSYAKVTVNSKGLVTAGGGLAASDITSALGYIPTGLVGFSMTGTITVARGNSTVAPLRFPIANALLATPTSGVVEYDGTNFYLTDSQPVRHTVAYTDSNITGSAAKLTTARTFTGNGAVTWSPTAFDGSANVTFTTSISSGAVTGPMLASGAASSNLGYVPLGGSNLTAPNTITFAAGTTTVAPFRFQAGTLLASPVSHTGEWDGGNLYLTTSGAVRKTVAYTDSNITGSAASLTTARTFTGSGDVVWSATSFNGTANVTFTTSISNASVTAVKLAANAALTNLGFTPLNKAGDTATGTLTAVAGTTTVAPLKFQAGVVLTTPVAHALEWDGSNLYATQATGPTRKTIAYTDSSITGSAAKWTSARTVAFATGDVLGSFATDGSANVANVVLTVGNSTITAAKLAANAALTNLGYTPANQAGDTFTGNIIVPTGSAALPSIAFAGDATPSGIYRVSANTLGFATNGGTRMYLTSSGFEGNNASSGRLTTGSASATVPTFTPNKGSATTGIGAFASGGMSFIANGTEIMRISSTVVTVPVRSQGDNSANAATTSYVDTGLATKLSLSGGTLTGVLSLAADPVNNLEAATKQYVDSAAQGLVAKAPAKAATTANVNLSNPGTAVFDGVTLTNGDRLLVKDQTSAAQNGIYVFATSSSALTRATDLDDWQETRAAFVFVQQGSLYANSGWVSQTTAGGTLGTTAMPWVQFSAAGNYSAGTGLTLSGSQFALTGQALALHNLSSSGMIVRTGSGTVAARTLTGPAEGISVTNGSGVAGNPTLALANDLGALEALTGTGFAVRTTTDTWTQRNIAISGSGLAVSNGDGLAGDPTLSLSAGLSALSAVSWSSGVQIPVLTAANTWSVKTIGQASGNVLDKAAGDALYLGLGGGTLTGGVQLGANSGSIAYGKWSLGDASDHLPSLEFFKKNGTRAGYIGYGNTANTIELAAENGYAFTFTNKSPTAPTPTSSDNSANVATTAFVQTAVSTAVASPGSTNFTLVNSNITLVGGSWYLVNTTAARSLALPALSGVPAGKAIRISDGNYQCLSNNITLTSNGTDQILYGADTGTTYIIDINGADIWLVATSSGWRVVVMTISTVPNSAGSNHHWVIVSSNITLIVGEQYLVNTTVNRSLTLPLLSSVSTGNALRVADLSGQASTHNITITAAGTDIFTTGGNSIAVNTNNADINIVATAGGWKVL